MDVLDLLWESVAPALYITKEQYLAGLDGWEVTPHVVDGAIVAAVLTKGPELHFVTFGPAWSLSRADLRRYLEPILEAHGVVTTKTPVEDARQRRFNKILGFEQTGIDEEYVYLALTRLPFSRSK